MAEGAVAEEVAVAAARRWWRRWRRWRRRRRRCGGGGGGGGGGGVVAERAGRDSPVVARAAALGVPGEVRGQDPQVVVADRQPGVGARRRAARVGGLIERAAERARLVGGELERRGRRRRRLGRSRREARVRRIVVHDPRPAGGSGIEVQGKVPCAHLERVRAVGQRRVRPVRRRLGHAGRRREDRDDLSAVNWNWAERLSVNERARVDRGLRRIRVGRRGRRGGGGGKDDWIVQSASAGSCRCSVRRLWRAPGTCGRREAARVLLR